MVFEKIKFLAANIAPKPDEVTYWVDISANPYGGVIKYYDGYDWIKLDQDSIAEDYLKLRNKPTLNGVVIEGNKTSKDYNIPTPESVELVLNDFRNEINNIDEKVSNVSIKLDNYIEANEGNIEDIKQDIVNIQESLELILGESASEVIDKFNEILSFLEGYDDSQTLKEVISNLETKLTELINNVEDDLDLNVKELKSIINNHTSDKNNPHTVTKRQVGLDQVDNTSDLNKPISTLTQQALDYEANLRDEMDTELMNRINVLQGEIDSAGKKIVTDIIDITQNNTSGVQLNYKYKDRVSFDDKYSDEKSASVLLNNASSTNNGVMSKEDKKKFDSIDSKIINNITSITYEPSNIKINYESQNLQDGVYVKSSETKIINSATTSSAGAMSSEDKQTLDAVKTTYIPLNQKGVANGVATLDENALIPSSQLPSYVDDVIECFATFTKNEDGSLSDISLYEDEEHSISITGEAGKIYVDITVRTVYNRAIEEGIDPIMTLAEEQAVFGNYQFRWTGTQFAVINASTVIGTIPGTAFDGGRGKQLEDLVNVINGSSSTEGSFRKADSNLQATINESISLLRDDINENVTSISEITNQINTINSNIQDVINGNVASATKLQTARLINGTAFDGTADIITNSWGEARNITIGNTKKSVNGSADVSWSLEEIGMDAYTKTEADDRYVNVSGDTMTGALIVLGKQASTFDNPGIIFEDNSGKIGTDTNNTMGIFAGGNIVLRPGSLTESSGKGLYVSTENIAFNENKVWHEGNDGSESGLDADLLDGIHANNLLYLLNDDFDPNTYDGYYVGMTTKSGIDTNWWHIISTSWGISNEGITGHKTWASQLALPTQNRNGLRYRSGNGESAYWSWIKVWDESNDGDGSGLDADLLDGRDYDQFLYNHGQNYGSSDDIRNITQWTYFSGQNMVNGPGTRWFSGIVMAANNNPNYKAILGFNEYGDFYTGGNIDGVWRAWQQVAYTTSNVASATKLQTPRSIWGQSFDGTGNVNGTLSIQANETNYCEGIRIKPYINWSTIVLCGNDLTSESGTSANTWSISNNNGSFWLNRNGSNIHTGYELCNINGNWGIGTTSPSQKLHVAGNVLATGFYRSSDIQLKTNIQPIDFTNNIELVSFNWKKDGSKSYGVIAQQVEQYYPELVSTDKSTGYKSVNYDAVLIIKCAQLENRIKQLEKELEDLKNE